MLGLTVLACSQRRGVGLGVARPERPSQALRAAESRKPFLLLLLIMVDGDSNDDISSFGP